MRSGRRSDASAVLEIDARSFDEFWALDRQALQAARKATPVHRYRVATVDRKVVGYAITGKSGSASFLQRLGVDPAVRGRGIGTELVADAMRWAVDDGAISMLVNTQVINETALRLYKMLGFELSDEQLMVLQWSR
jgi:ribosomal-protein-alanine N-acetyltransferase